MWRAALVGVVGCGFSVGGAPGDGDVRIDTVASCDGPCLRLVPSNQADISALDVPDLPDLNMGQVDPDGGTCAWRIYTDTGQIEHESAGVDAFSTYRAAGLGVDAATRLRFEYVGANMAVLYVDRLMVATDVRFEGYGPRSLIVIARGAISVDGELDFSAGYVMPGGADAAVDFTRGGPGGGDGGRNSAIDTLSGGCGGIGVGGGDGQARSGGGGGGGGLAGGKGGDQTVGILVGGPGGMPCVVTTLIPLLGGGGGGAADPLTGGGSGGGGGGAIQLTSIASIQITGTIDVGGKGGRAQQLNDDGGGGGGAGGGILLEAPVVTIGGATLAANGGGGGSGRLDNNGMQGTLTASPAAGGLGSGGSDDDGRGGSGGAGTTAANPGDDHSPGGGGGGGSVGVIRINGTLGGSALVISPPHTTGELVYAPP